MAGLSSNANHLLTDTSCDAAFPHAPLGWSRRVALNTAQQEHIKMTQEHWQVIFALQEFYAQHDGIHIKMRELHDVLEEHFMNDGGIKHLCQLFPEGPVAQSCRVAGLKAPVFAI